MQSAMLAVVALSLGSIGCPPWSGGYDQAYYSPGYSGW